MNTTTELTRLYKICRLTGSTAIAAIFKARIWIATYPDTSFIILVN